MRKTYEQVHNTKKVIHTDRNNNDMLLLFDVMCVQSSFSYFVREQ